MTEPWMKAFGWSGMNAVRRSGIRMNKDEGIRIMTMKLRRVLAHKKRGLGGKSPECYHLSIFEVSNDNMK